MAVELETTESKVNANIHNASFAGGVTRGRCFQMNQMHRDGNDVHTVQLTRDQVVKQIAIMAEWLGE